MGRVRFINSDSRGADQYSASVDNLLEPVNPVNQLIHSDPRGADQYSASADNLWSLPDKIYKACVKIVYGCAKLYKGKNDLRVILKS